MGQHEPESHSLQKMHHKILKICESEKLESDPSENNLFGMRNGWEGQAQSDLGPIRTGYLYYRLDLKIASYSLETIFGSLNHGT